MVLAAEQLKPGASEPPAFERIYQTEFNYVWNFLVRMGVAQRDRGDVTHDVFEAVYRSLERYDPARPLRPWITGVAFRVATNFLRRAWVRQEIPREVETRSARPDAEALASQQERRALLLRALAEISADQRAVIVLHDLEGHSIPVVAEILEVKAATLYSRLRTGRQQLARAVRRLSRLNTTTGGR